ncbi:gastrula zinc finger protein XlCGF8.2DB-like [Cheilinus undulatus]|uniref:gastrula zinc finger protein XlCGF8.2DB-like n=1 Tax=Cheilinus undulatus TaxID=241271 RepID=UPI001BD250FB|nr:gastrula zinc finger protein XlCGF8.2DB-like [Cheilinus undulatus]
MSNIQILRSVVNQRLNAAVEEVFELFERTIAEYEEKLRASKEENHRQQKLLDAVLTPEIQLHRPDVQQLMMREEVFLSEQEDRSSNLDQRITVPLHIKEEHEDLQSSQEREQLPEAEEDFINMLTVTSVPVRTEEEDGENPQTSLSCQSQREENRDTKIVKTEADGEDCGGSAANKHFNPDSHLQTVTPGKFLHLTGSENSGSADLKKSGVSQGGLNPLQNKDIAVSVMLINTGNIPVSSAECAPSFGLKTQLQGHREIKKGDKPFSCSVCKKSFQWRAEIVRHMRVHTGEKPFSCSVCGKRFALFGNLRQHAPIHTGEKPFGCSVCHRKFTWHASYKNHKCVVKSSQT